MCVSFVARFRVLCWGGGGSLSSPFGVIICVYCDYPFTCFGYFFLCFLLFVGFLSSFSLPFSGFLFCFSFAASSSRSLSLPPSPLSSCSFLAFPSSALFSSFFGFSFPPSSPLPHPPFRSRFGFFFSLLWPLFLGFLFPFLLFLLCPLPSSLFFLFVFLAFGFRFLLVCVFGLFWSSLCFSCWCFQSRGSPFVPVSLSSLLISRRLLLLPLLLLLSSSRLFLIFPLLCLFFLFFFYFVPSCRLCCCASLSPAPSSASLSFAHSSVLSLSLFGSAWGGGFGSGAVTVLHRQS